MFLLCYITNHLHNHDLSLGKPVNFVSLDISHKVFIIELKHSRGGRGGGGEVFLNILATSVSGTTFQFIFTTKYVIGTTDSVKTCCPNRCPFSSLNTKQYPFLALSLKSLDTKTGRKPFPLGMFDISTEFITKGKLATAKRFESAVSSVNPLS